MAKHRMRNTANKMTFLCQFPLLQECPEQHKSAWARAHGYVLSRWRGATFSQHETDTALLWLGFLPQALLRKPSRGGKVGRAQVAHRFNCITNNDWGGLVEAWEGDVKKMQEKRRGQTLKIQMCSHSSRRSFQPDKMSCQPQFLSTLPSTLS